MKKREKSENQLSFEEMLAACNPKQGMSVQFLLKTPTKKDE